MPFLNTLLIMMSQTSCSRQLKRIISLNLCYEKRYLKKVTLEGHKLNSQSLTQVGQASSILILAMNLRSNVT